MIEIEKYIDKHGLFDGRYLLLRQLSTAGGTADVWLAEDKETADKEFSDENDDEVIEIEGSAILVAIKIYCPKNILDAEGVQTFKKEYKTVYNSHHANLLKPTGFSIIEDSIPYLVMPYCEKGSAEKLIGKIGGLDAIWKFIYDTASGLAYLHYCNPSIIHQDIKPANILIDNNDNYCITDFGISVKTGKNVNDYSDDEISGTIIYMPPERFREEYKPNAKSDVWSLGATIYELVTGDVPFGNEGGQAQSKGAKIPEIKGKYPRRLKKLVYGCLDANPDKRPTAEVIAEIARHKGKRFAVLNVIVLAIVFVAVGTIIWTLSGKSRPITPFEALCNRGDSIISIEKNNATRETSIDYYSIDKKLRDAISCYEKAIQEGTSVSAKRDSINNRINSICELFPMLSRYKEVCDSLQIAIDDNAEIQKDSFKKKKLEMSNIIKNRITKL